MLCLASPGVTQLAGQNCRIDEAGDEFVILVSRGTGKPAARAGEPDPDAGAASDRCGPPLHRFVSPPDA
jgi:hypothetical protein